MSKRLKIGFLSVGSPESYNSWSGITQKQFELLSSCNDVEWIAPPSLSLLPRIYLMLVKAFWVRLCKKNLRTPFKIKARDYGKKITVMLKNKNFEVLFVSNATELFAFAEIETPSVFFSDCTAKGIIHYYPDYSNIPAFYEKNLLEMDKLCLNKAKHIVYTSMWATCSAENDYLISPEKISILPFSPNLPITPESASLKVVQKNDNSCSLVFIAKDWKRKGGDIVLKTWAELRNMGIDCKLTIIGCSVPDHLLYLKDQYLIEIKRLNKNNPSELNDLIGILFETDFLMLPTRADCTPIVFSEASCFGIPSISCNTGGIASSIIDGINGFVLPFDADYNEYANLIYSVFVDKIKYAALRKSTRAYYETALEPKVWQQKMNEIFETAISSFNEERTLH